MVPIVDPRQGDAEDDACSTKRRSLFSLAGSLLVEISLPKLIAAWAILLILPAVLLGLAPLVASAWVAAVAGKILSPAVEILPLLVFLAIVTFGLLFWRRLLQLAESSFWSLNALVIEPGYTMWREGLRHLTERFLPESASQDRRWQLRAATAAGAGILISGVALAILVFAWPHSRWIGGTADFLSPLRLVPVALANAVVLVCAYFATTALAWALADMRMPPPRDYRGFQRRESEAHLSGTQEPAGRTWRIAHLSDLHTVGERYGFRIESGRSGARGNERLHRTLALLEEIDTADPLHVIVISGDMTDAGRSAEWAEFLDALAAHPRLAGRVLMLPGNHDINIVDRANPARLDLPFSPNTRLRKIRALSAINMLQGERVHVVDHAAERLGKTLADVVQAHASELATFAESARPHFSTAITELWNDVFPMVMVPEPEDGLGVILLNSNCDSHFSFTNALGMIPEAQIRGLEIATAAYPRARWLVVLHHHVVEYPSAAKVLSERIGTALVNSNSFVRRLRPMAERIIVMHGHRHIDWIGECGGLVIVSAPSPVMEATDDQDSYFYIHTLEGGKDGHMRLLRPERIVVPGADENETSEPGAVKMGHRQ